MEAGWGVPAAAALECRRWWWWWFGAVGKEAAICNSFNSIALTSSMQAGTRSAHHLLCHHQ